jgi:Tfp pilus assembly protein PilN
MAQHLNLMHAGLVRRREPFGSREALLWVGAAAALALGGAFAMQWQARQTVAQADQLEKDATTLQARVIELAAVPAATARTSELQRLRAAEASQRRVRDAIASGAAGRTQGYAEYFTALARQAQPALWITGFAVAPDGVALELQGRMADPRQLPEYLRRLNAEALFKGREFAQLSLKAVDASAAASGGYTEFSLRGLPTAAEASK